MRTRAWIMLCWLGLLTGGLRAQTVEDAEKALHGQLVNQRLVARGFSAEAEVHYQWTASALLMSVPKLRTFGVVEVNSIKVKNGQVEIRGTCKTLFKVKGKLALTGMTSVRLLVDLAGADPITALPQLKQRLFYGTLDEALAAIPTNYQKWIPFDPTPSAQSPGDEMAMETCGSKPSEFHRTVVVFSAEPEFSQEAMRGKFNGTVDLALTVDVTGHPVDLWLAAPIGHGLDENAVDAVRQYIFKPATCKGTPVPVVLVINVKFAIS